MEDCGCSKGKAIPRRGNVKGGISRRGILKGGLVASVVAMLTSIGIIKPAPAHAADCYWQWMCLRQMGGCGDLL